MGRIEATFDRLRAAGEKALIPFITAGDPDLATSEALLHTLIEAGADLIELGVPFSDPMADGPTIQASSERALKAGTTLGQILALVARVRLRTSVPVVLMGYYNPIFRYGPERFAREAAAAGVDGVLLVDLPPEEAGEVRDAFRNADLRLITLLAPTTPPRRRDRLAAGAEGYLYYVSMTGVTGTQAVDAGAIADEVTALQAKTAIPVAVGFGITTPADAAAVGRFADGVVVGSALVRIVADCGSGPELLPRVRTYVAALKAALRGVAA